MKRLSILILIVLALTSLSTTFAASQSQLTPIGGKANTCVMANTWFTFPVSYVYTGTGSDQFRLTAPGYGQLNSSFTQEPHIGLPIGSGTSGYGTGLLNYSLPDHTPITITLTTFSGDNYTGTSVTASFTYDCTTGAATSGLYEAAPVPSGFVLRTITCDTPIYDTANGSPLISGEKVTVGQTWFVNPTAKGDWIEIFNNGYSNGFVPSSCIGGAPAGF
ncbi:MAG TPA: hypothetical protein VHP83_07345 [Aggregatilineaceae bacterium]|nr:hypothetical protein [Aggregatilineaceae bacterium]